jgi:hypothetical protein
VRTSNPALKHFSFRSLSGNSLDAAISTVVINRLTIWKLVVEYEVMWVMTHHEWFRFRVMREEELFGTNYIRGSKDVFKCLLTNEGGNNMAIH